MAIDVKDARSSADLDRYQQQSALYAMSADAAVPGLAFSAGTRAQHLEDGTTMHAAVEALFAPAAAFKLTAFTR